MSRLVLPTSVIWWLIIDGLAVYRLTRVVGRDTLFDRPRGWFTTTYRGWVVELLMCSWCLSVWFAAVAGVLTWQVPQVWIWVALPLAVAAVAGLVAAHE